MTYDDDSVLNTLPPLNPHLRFLSHSDVKSLGDLGTEVEMMGCIGGIDFFSPHASAERIGHHYQHT